MPELSLSIMTWNLYLGADVGRVIGVAPELLPERVTEVWKTVNATNFRARAKAIAAGICRECPDVVALQEVCRWSSRFRLPLAHEPPEERIEYDFIGILLDELRRRGENYFIAARSPGVDVLLPSAGGPDIRLEDSLVLLLRAGRAANGLRWARPRSGRFTANLRTTLDGDPFEISRGWVSVDLVEGNQIVRVINTHLEYFHPALQPAQLTEVLNGPGASPRCVILTGDFNGPPGSQAWQMLRDSAFVDAWETAGAGPGYTAGRCERLRNSEPALSRRIDWIMCRGPFEILQASQVGADPSDRTADGLWPSDHAGISARVSVRNAA